MRGYAAGVNPADVKIRERGRFPSGETPPFILGFDVSGSVAAVGEGVALYRVGDEVFGMPRFPHPAGGYAQFLAAPARHLAPKPAAWSHRQAAALPLAGLTAWQALIDTTRVQPGERVLVHAAAGGVGHLAVQIAVAVGAEVVASASRHNHELLADLGAHLTLDRHTDDLDRIGPVDVVLDPVGGTTTQRSLAMLSRGGRLVRLPPWSEADWEMRARAARRGVYAVRMLVEPDVRGLLALTDLVKAEHMRAIVSDVFPLDEVRNAHRSIQGHRTVGKIVLDV